MPRLLLCVDNSAYRQELTVGEAYVCKSEDSFYYDVIDNKGDSTTCYKWRFEVIEGPMPNDDKFTCCVCEEQASHTSPAWPRWHRFPTIGESEDGTDPA